ncbi:MAG: hypothetical protein DRP47_09465 [Candidatus Zixiibacteriota bacterium]|nr:MAG: hypothetical protein DRP47_09465 [candidate division Zixibacteria bacterium]
MDYQALKKLERELATVLKEEYSFYQALYITLDKQRDLIKFDSDASLLDLFAEIERCRLRIKRSENKIAEMKKGNPQGFRMVSVLPDVKKIINSITTLIKKNRDIVTECESYLKGRSARIKEELVELRNSEKILQYMSDGDPTPQFVNSKE